MKALVKAGPPDQRVDMCNGGGGSCTTASIKAVGEDTDENVDGKRQYLRFLSTLEREGGSMRQMQIFIEQEHSALCTRLPDPCTTVQLINGAL